MRVRWKLVREKTRVCVSGETPSSANTVPSIVSSSPASFTSPLFRRACNRVIASLGAVAE